MLKKDKLNKKTSLGNVLEREKYLDGIRSCPCRLPFKSLSHNYTTVFFMLLPQLSL